MFSRIVTPLLLASSLFSSVFSTPLFMAHEIDVMARGNPQPENISLNNWHGLSSMANFDNFFGQGNFDDHKSTQIVVEKNVEVCHAQQIEIVQQRLLILQEMARRVITEFICDVETQVIVFEQFQSRNAQYKNNLGRLNGKSTGYDRSIVGHYSNIVDGSGALTSNDLGIKGYDSGKNYVVYGGSNWNAQSSPSSVEQAFQAAKGASSPTYS